MVIPVNVKDEALRTAAEQLYAECQKAGFDTVMDDRDERPGVKFKDAELVGIPWRITVGKKLGQGIVEVVERRTGKLTEVPVGEAVEFVRAALNPPA